MDLWSNIALGFGVAFQPTNLLFAFIGALLGTLIGVLPGIGPTATMALLLPMTFGLPVEASVIMLAGIYYGAQYGGSTTAILLNLPGETSSVVTVLDGHQMARQGRAGSALAIAALGSLFAGSIATLFLAAFAAPMASVALSFQSPEYTSLILFGLLVSVVLASGSVLKSIAMVVLGVAIGVIGVDITTGQFRFTFGMIELADGIDFVPLAMGIFGIAEIVRNLENRGTLHATVEKISRLWPTGDDFHRSWPAVLRGTGLGSLLGVLPGGGATLSSFASYSLEKKVNADPSRFGKGAVEGVAGPESANNAAAQTSFIPLLTLGLPTNAVMALLVGAFIIQGVQPGPMMLQQQPNLFWGLIASMWIGNLMLVVINLPLIGVWVRLLSIRYDFLFPAILMFCAIGAYSLNNSAFDIFVMIGFGLVGYLFMKLGCEPAPLLLGFVLGPMLEENVRRAMLLSRGDPMIFLERPISLTILVALALTLAAMLLPALRRRRKEAFVEEEA
ncbi:tripartite tricarboxylate transporter permease [Aureimonas mangrovi]|uniref:tripartite tricarboxylate transporter permease n=1 Tax=Aureimonas mangrovi TaxID=2758041 RepID=UPI00163DB9D4|nr:tripartite tricarboxylate transporter permease [Aureimonas mangrovi]